MNDTHPLPHRQRLHPPHPYERAHLLRLVDEPKDASFTYQFAPSPVWHYVFKRGMSGNGVAVLQANLRDIAVDGDFGKATEARVEEFQSDNGLVPIDGIAGGATQHRIVLVRSTRYSKEYKLPSGLLASIANTESGFYLEAFSRHPSDAGYDIGPFQLSIGGVGGVDPTQTNFWLGYDAARMAERTSRFIRAEHDMRANNVPSSYRTDLAHGDSDRFAWMLGVLDHNWPFAANNIGKFGHIHPDDPGRDDRYASWVDTASGGRLTTERQWVYTYIRNGTIYVRW